MNLTETNTKSSISIDDMIKELNFFNYDLTGMTEDEIKLSFYKHTSDNLEEIEIQDLFKNKQNNEVLIESPDDLQTLGFYVAKSERTCYYLETENGSNIKCSLDHFVETINGFQKTENLTLDDIILTKNGYSKLTTKNDIGESVVFDFEVEHENERYYNTNGISNHNTGKTFLCLNFVKTAQKQDYYVIYLDSENAIDLNLCNKFGIDTTKFRIDPIATVEDLKVYLAKFIKKMQDMKDEGYELPKVLLVLDSLGNLASNKEVNDAETGNEKADMTRAKQLKSIFRIVTQKLGILGIPLLMTNHTYMTQEMFPREIFSGGTGAIYNASIIVMLSKAKLKDGNEDEQDLGQSGIIVSAKTTKNRLAKPKKIKFELSFNKGSNPYSGLEFWCTPENFDVIGIAKGKPVIEDDVDTSTGEIIGKKTSINPGGNFWYIRHLDKSVPTARLNTKEVFTPEVLNAMAPILEDYFKYRDMDELQTVEEELDKISSEFAEHGNADDVDAEKLFE